MPETLLVTGSNGLIGQKIVNALGGRTALRVVALSRGANRNTLTDGYIYHTAELTDRKHVAALFEQYKPQYVVHAAGMTLPDACEQDPASCQRDNLDTVRVLVEQCLAQQSQLYQLSTDFVFDGAAGPYHENHAPAPLQEYGRTKLAAEHYILQSPIRSCILRTQLVYGTAPGLGRSNLVLWVRKALSAGMTIRVVNDQLRSPTLAEDVAAGVIAAVMRRSTGFYHLSGNEVFSVYDIACQVARFWQLDEKLITPVPTAELNEAAQRPLRSGFITLKAQTELGFRPHTLQEGLTLLNRQLVG